MSQKSRIFRRHEVGDVINEIIHKYHDPYFTSEFINIIAPFDIIADIVKIVTKLDTIRPKVTFGNLGTIIDNNPAIISKQLKSGYRNHISCHVTPYMIFRVSASLLNFVTKYKVGGCETFIFYKKPSKLKYIDNRPVWNRKALYIDIIDKGISLGAYYYYDFICVIDGMLHGKSNGVICDICGKEMAGNSYVAQLVTSKQGGLKSITKDKYYCLGHEVDKNAKLVNLVDPSINKKYIKFAQQVSRTGLKKVDWCNEYDEYPKVWQSGKYEIIDSRYEGDYVTNGGKLVVINMNHVRDLKDGFSFVPSSIDDDYLNSR